MCNEYSFGRGAMATVWPWKSYPFELVSLPPLKTICFLGVPGVCFWNPEKIHDQATQPNSKSRLKGFVLRKMAKQNNFAASPMLVCLKGILTKYKASWRTILNHRNIQCHLLPPSKNPWDSTSTNEAWMRYEIENRLNQQLCSSYFHHFLMM